MIRHYAKLVLSGRIEPLVVKVSQEVSEQLDSVFSEAAGAEPRFVLFDRSDGGVVAVSRPDVQLAHLLWDDGLPPIDNEEPPRIEIYLRGRQEPLTSGADLDARDELEQVLDQLEQWSPDAGLEYVSFADEDGERLFVRHDQLLALAVPSAFLEDGEDDGAEMDEDSDASSPLVQ